VIYWAYEQVFLAGKRSVVKNKESARQPTECKRQGDGFKKRWGLQLRMTISYVGVSVATALLLELLLLSIFFLSSYAFLSWTRIR